MCMPCRSLSVSPSITRRVILKRRYGQSFRLRAETHCHELNYGIVTIIDRPSQDIDFFIDGVYSMFPRKNRRRL